MMFEIPITEFKNLKIGNMENTDAGTGCTVFLFEKGAPAGLDVRGGGPASEESELLKPMAAAEKIHAIVLSGGSAFGLNRVPSSERSSISLILKPATIMRLPKQKNEFSQHATYQIKLFFT